MLRVQPFLALRPAGSRAVLVSCPPVGGECTCCDHAPNADSFRCVLEAGGTESVRAAIGRLIDAGALAADPEPRMFVYRIARGSRRQIGVVASVCLGDLLGPPSTAPAWAEPGTVLFDDPEGRVALLAADDMNERPIFHFNASDGTTHTGWLVRDPSRYVRAFEEVHGAGELLSPAAASDPQHALALLVDRASLLHPKPDPRCGLFVQTAVLQS